MRITRLTIAAAALLVTAPGWAQNTTTPTTTDVNAVGNTATANMTVPAPAPRVTESTAIRETGGVTTAPERKRSFPWGVLGLLGLLGLIPRARRG